MSISCRFTLIILLFLMNGNNIFPQTDTTKNNTVFNTFIYDFVFAYKDYAYIGKQIMNPDESAIPWIGIGSAATCSGFIFDEDVRKISQKSQTKANDKLYSFTNEFGNTIYPMILSGGIYLGGLFFKEDGIRITGRLCFEGLLLAGITTTISKIVFGRARPYTNEGIYKFHFFQFKDEYFSFPSGHTTVAFTMASVLSRRINTWWAYAILYPAATMTAMARIYKDQHWASDVILGAFVGIVSGYAVCTSNENLYYNNKTKAGIKLYPTMNGLGMSYCL